MFAIFNNEKRKNGSISCIVLKKRLTLQYKYYYMAKRLPIILLLLVAFSVLPLTISAATTMETIAPEAQVGELAAPSVELKNNHTLVVNGLEGQVLEVVSLTGKNMMSVKIEAATQRVELNNLPKGCYVVKVGKVVRKISIT